MRVSVGHEVCTIRSTAPPTPPSTGSLDFEGGGALPLMLALLGLAFLAPPVSAQQTGETRR